MAEEEDNLNPTKDERRYNITIYNIYCNMIYDIYESIILQPLHGLLPYCGKGT